MRRTEADLQAAGLLDVAIATTAGGRPLGVLERLPDAPATSTTRARRNLCPRPERRSERLERRHAPWRRQQSDRRNCGGVPGLYVRARDLDELDPRNCPGRAPRRAYGTTSLGPASELTARETRARVARAWARRPRSNPPDQDTRETRSSGSTTPRSRWAALSRWRTAGTGRAGPDRLRQGARSGAPPVPIAVAAFESVFASNGPHGWGLDDLGRPLMLLDGYRPISARWAERLEAYCRIHDRATGEAGSGLLSLIEDVFRWEPADGAPRGGRHDVVDLNGRPTRHVSDPGYPASLAYFIARLGVRAKALRRRGDFARRERSADWRELMRPPGPDPHREAWADRFWTSYYADLEDLG